MSIFQINKNTFAIGTKGKRAKYVVRTNRGKASGVRGQRPVLDARFKKVAAPKLVKAAFAEALA